MESEYHFSIITPDGVYYESPVLSLIAPGTAGFLGVLAHHARLCTTLSAGRVRWRDAQQQSHQAKIGVGFLEIGENRAVILTEKAQPVE